MCYLCSTTKLSNLMSQSQNCSLPWVSAWPPPSPFLARQHLFSCSADCEFPENTVTSNNYNTIFPIHVPQCPKDKRLFLINFIKGVSDKIWDAFIFLGRREGNMPLWPCMNPAAKSGLCLNDGTDVVMLMKLAESSGLLSKEHFAFIYPEETFLGSACPACISGHWLYPQKHAPFDKMMCVLEKLQMLSEICHSAQRRRFGTSTSRVSALFCKTVTFYQSTLQRDQSDRHDRASKLNPDLSRQQMKKASEHILLSLSAQTLQHFIK